MFVIKELTRPSLSVTLCYLSWNDFVWTFSTRFFRFVINNDNNNNNNSNFYSTSIYKDTNTKDAKKQQIWNHYGIRGIRKLNCFSGIP